MFKVNQKVVCIDDSPGVMDNRRFLVKDFIYTIGELNNINGIWLVEDDMSKMPISIYNGVPCIFPYWRPSRFRSLVGSNILKELLKEIVDERSDVQRELKVTSSISK